MTQYITQDGNEFVSSTGEVWVKTKSKDVRRTKGKTFLYYPCKICGRLISNAGFANHNHLEMHRRKGECDDRYQPLLEDDKQ